MDLTNLQDLPKPQVEVTMEQAEAAEALPKTDEAPVHDATAIEAQMLAEEQARLNKEPDQEEIACMMLKLYTPRFNSLVDELSNRQLRRLIKSLIEFPLGKDYKHVDKTESEAFAVGQGLLDAKMILVIKTYNDNKDQIIAMAAEAAKNTTIEYGDKAENNEEQKEVTNG